MSSLAFLRSVSMDSKCSCTHHLVLKLPNLRLSVSKVAHHLPNPLYSPPSTPYRVPAHSPTLVPPSWPSRRQHSVLPRSLLQTLVISSQHPARFSASRSFCSRSFMISPTPFSTSAILSLSTAPCHAHAPFSPHLAHSPLLPSPQHAFEPPS
jgi:hypothetical protein